MTQPSSFRLHPSPPRLLFLASGGSTRARAKRIEFFRREDDARTSGVGLDAGGKATLNGPKVPYNGWKYSVSVADLMRDFMLPTSPRAYSHGESLPQVLPARMSLGCRPREENDRSHLALLTAKRFSSTNPRFSLGILGDTGNTTANRNISAPGLSGYHHNTDE